MKIGRNKIRLQSLSVDSDEFSRIILGPSRKMNVIQALTTLFDSKVKLVSVDKKVREIEKLRDEFSNVCHVVFAGTFPGFLLTVGQKIHFEGYS